jgi:UDP-galactopyranose mutase
MYSGFDILVIGAGISGVVIAERYASQGKKVLVLEKRDHLGGNCFDYQNQHGIRVSKYGAHLFHTNSQKVWDYLQDFAQWKSYEHKVLAKVEDKFVSLPINIKSINQFFDQKLETEAEMRTFLQKKTEKIANPQSSKDWALSKIGKELYEAIFENYSQKQWGLDLSELDSSVISRLPVRYNSDDRYFTDQYQALPQDGFEALFKKMLSSQNIKVLLNKDYFQIKDQLPEFEKVFYTGPIDKYFEYQYGALEYRSLNIQFEEHQQEQYQENAAINYPSLEYPFTRIIEYKHLYPAESEWTTISKEYPVWGGEPFYPVPRKKNKEIYQKYVQEAKKLEDKGIYFLGRLASYKYINMDQAFAEALNLYQRLSS